MKNNKLMRQITQFIRAQSTVLNWFGFKIFTKQGFYIPYRYARDVKPSNEKKYCQWLKEQFDINSQKFIKCINDAAKYNDEFINFHCANADDINQPRFNQEWFSGLDGAMAYAMVRELKPNNIIEIGSGHSTRFLAQAIKDEKLTCHLHSIDPQPRREIDKICSEITRHTVTDVAIEKMSRLKANDILFIDGSHIFVDNTDVEYLFTEVLPQLSNGVHLHIHDIFLPHGYPSEWQWRGYNEQNALLAMIGAKGRYEIVCPNAYLRQYHDNEVKKLSILLNDNAFESSLWLKINQS